MGTLYLREAAKKSSSLNGRVIKRGGWVKGRAGTRKKELFLEPLFPTFQGRGRVFKVDLGHFIL